MAFIFSLRASTSTRAPIAFSSALHLVGVVDVALGDGHDLHLRRREPQREGAGIVLDEHAEKALDRAVERAMHHQRLMALPILADVFEAEALRQVEVELHGRKLPEAADGVHQLDVDFRPVECGLAGDELVGNAALAEHLLQRVLRRLPLLFAADVVAAVVGVPGGELDLELGESVGIQHGLGKVDAADDLVFDLLRRAEDVGVILGKAAYAHQPVHDARALVAIDRAQLAQADRQVAVGAKLILVNEDVERAIHRLHAVFGVVQLDRGEHVLGVEALVSAGLPELAARHVRGVHQRVAALQVLLAHPVFHLLADDAALGMPEDEPRSGQFLDGEQVELLAEHAMVAPLGFLHLVHVLVEIFLAEESGAVDALQLRILFLAEPVGAGDVQQLEGLDFAGRGNVRAAAEVDELAGLVERNLFVGLGEFLDEVALHEIAFGLEARQSLLARQKLARVGLVALHDLLHLLLDLLEVFGGKRRGAIEVVKESVLGGGAVSELGLGKKFKHGGGHEVRRRVPVNLKRLGIAIGEQAQAGVALQRPGEIGQIAVSICRMPGSPDAAWWGFRAARLWRRARHRPAAAKSSGQSPAEWCPGELAEHCHQVAEL